MESITKGECPAELDPGSRTQQVSVNLVRSEKAYEAPPKPKYRAFTGTGQTLAGGMHLLVNLAHELEIFRVIGIWVDQACPFLFNVHDLSLYLLLFIRPRSLLCTDLEHSGH